MSSFYQIIVDRDAKPEDVVAHMSRIREWLVSEAIVEPSAILDAHHGPNEYPAGPNYSRVVVEPQSTPDTCDFITERQAYWTGPEPWHIVCDECNTRSDPDELAGDPWGAALRDWQRAGQGPLACPACGATRPISEWTHDPPWGFGTLAVRFRDWPPLTQEFIDELTQQLRHRTVYVWHKV